MSNRSGYIGERIRQGVKCQVCKSRPAIDYWKKNFICDACMNPPPTKEYYAEQRASFCDVKTSFGMITTVK